MVKKYSFTVSGRQVQISLDKDEFTQKNIIDYLAAGMLYESGTVNFLAHTLKKGDTFICVGAHVGYFTLVGRSLVGKEGKVYSFEPNLKNYRQLVENTTLFENIDVSNCAVGSSVGKATLYINRDNDGGHALWDVSQHSFNKKTRKHKKERVVPVTTLDSFTSFQDAKVVKIDAEGNETAIVKGAFNILKKVPHVICEINHFALKRMGSSEDELFGLMGYLGYKPYVINDIAPYLVSLDGQMVNETDVYNILFSRGLWQSNRT